LRLAKKEFFGTHYEGSVFIGMKIFYLGSKSYRTTSRHRADALVRLGHDVNLFDPYEDLSPYLSGRLKSMLHYRTGYRFLQVYVRRWIRKLFDDYGGRRPDIIWIDGGELFGYSAVNMLRQFNCPIVLYNLDDPMSSRDGRRFDSLRSALRAYDLCVVVRQENVSEFKAYGVRAVMRVWRSYDEVMHRPFEDVNQIPLKFRSDVAFIGAWIRGEQRDRFLLELIDRGLNLAIWGNHWNKAPTWNKIKPYWCGSALFGRDYVAAIQGAKIALGLLSHGNRDLHTTRSVEIPYAGGLLCAERTSEHLEMYREDLEAVFWKDVDECVEKCRRLLADGVLRERIRKAGMQRVRELGVGNEDVCNQVLTKIVQLDIKEEKDENKRK